MRREVDRASTGFQNSNDITLQIDVRKLDQLLQFTSFAQHDQQLPQTIFSPVLLQTNTIKRV